MPELPEVETVARGLRGFVLGKKIERVIVHSQKKIFGAPKDYHTHVHGAQVTGIERRGKWLIINLSTDWHLVIHLKMTGQLLFQAKLKKQRPTKLSQFDQFTVTTAPTFLGGHTMGTEIAQLPNSHTRAEILFSNGGRLFFQDMRLFGYIHLLSDTELQEYFATIDLGPEPMDATFSLDYFTSLCKRRARTSIKALLLDQSAIAGLGNIYVDEACWLAKVRPQRRVGSLTTVERKRLWAACRNILNEAIELGGTSFSDYYQVDGTIGQYWSRRRVYGRTGEPCKRCKSLIKKTRAAGRGTHYCPGCQV
jgi:formamidopyrimidine-DNA glycosylase